MKYLKETPKLSSVEHFFSNSSETAFLSERYELNIWIFLGNHRHEWVEKVTSGVARGH